MSLLHRHALLGNQSSLQGNYLDDYLGSELGWCFGFVRRFSGYNGKVATLRRLSDSATYDLYFPSNSNEINWSDSALLTFVSGAEVEVAELFNQMPSANRIVTSVTATTGLGATIYEGGAFKTLTGRSEVAMDFNGSDEYFEGSFTTITRQFKLYFLGVGENSSAGSVIAQSLTQNGSSFTYHYQGFNTTGARGQFRASTNIYTVDGGVDTTDTPSICSYQESFTDRRVYQNGIEQDEDLNNANTASRDLLLIGRLRTTDGIYLGGKTTEIIGFLSDKTSNRSDIDSTINLDYSF